MKKYFLIIIIFILTSCISRYKTSTLFENDGYKYNITYPVSKHNEWFLFHGSTDASIIEFKNESLHALAIITKQNSFFGGSIEVYILNRDSSIYKTLSDPLKEEDSNTLFFDIQDKERKINFEDIYKWSVNKDDSSLTIAYNLNQNKALLFLVDENAKDKKEISKEIYKIINSLTREKINNK